MSTNNVYVVAIRRSPIGRLLGGLGAMPAPAVGAQVAKAALAAARTEPSAIDEVYVGEVLQAGVGHNPARQVALGAGLPDTISACTVNKVCGSGMQSIMFASHSIKAGEADVVLAGGIESMSLAPFLVRGIRAGNKFGDMTLVDVMQYDGLTNVYDNTIMGIIADETATRAGITRRQQDEFACRSHQRATAAEREGRSNEFRAPIDVPRAKERFNTDETIRSDVSLDALSNLKPVFNKDGTVTAGNASAISDGAAMAVIAGERGLKKTSGAPIARIIASATSGGPPRDLFFAPIRACQMVVQKAGWEPRNVDLWELNEAFASQMCACMKGLELDPEKVNVDGGAIALGHPIGASGTRILGTLLYALKHRNLKRGVASLCLGGGNAVAMAVELV